MSLLSRIRALLKGTPKESPPVRKKQGGTKRGGNKPTAPTVAPPSPLKQYARSYRKDR